MSFGGKVYKMTILAAILVGFLLLLGFVGCVVPFIPGVWIAYAALWVLWAMGWTVGTGLLVAGGIAAIVVTILDFVVPAWGAKRFHCSRRGQVGCVIGTIVGAFVLPWGIVLGPFLGALFGELTLGRSGHDALLSGVGALLGFLFGVLLKFVLCGVYAVWCVRVLL